MDMSSVLDKIQTFWRRYGQSSAIKSFQETQIQEDAFDAKIRGTHRIPLTQIVGSVGRYHDFDQKFRLRHHLSSDRFEHVKQLMEGGVPLPPVKLYQIKDDYYVLDGNHRVSAAKALGHTDIEAHVVEFLPSPTTVENMLYREKSEFFEKTGIRGAIELTEIGQYHHLLDHIQTHQQFLEQTQSEPISLAYAAEDWYRTIYQPLVALIKKGRLLASFPQRTPGDLYAYIALHQWDKQLRRSYSSGIDHLLTHDMEEFRKTMKEKVDLEYPEMQREITAFVLMNVSGKEESRIIEKLFAFPEVREIHSVHGNIDLLVKVILIRDLLSSDAETISYFVNDIRQIPGVINTQTLIPGLSKIKDSEE